MTESKNIIKNRISEIPKKPGVYLHSNKKGEVIYVGKSNSLYERIKFYFTKQEDISEKVKELIYNISDFDYIVTETEQEALLLENQLIKRHKPKYNARLKDDKSYPFIKITKNEDFPQVIITRNPKRNDKNKYFGPYSSVSSVRKTLNLLSKIFPYRSCNKLITGNDKNACIEFEIARCNAPCIGNASKSEYSEVINSVESFLNGNTSPIVKDLKKDMKQASMEQKYEKAAIFRDRIQSIQKLLEKQKVSGLRNESFDLVALHKSDQESMIVIFKIRKGNMIGHEKINVEKTKDILPEEIIRLFMIDFYSKAIDIPNNILVSHIPNESDAIKNLLEMQINNKIKILKPLRGIKKDLLEMATSNAKEALLQWQIKWINDSKKTQKALSELQMELGLINIPKRIECFDISHIQGTSVVGSMSVFENGFPKKSDYRRFKLSKDKNDDFASIREIIERRYSKLKGKNTNISKKLDSFSKYPDLILIDGGKGQLSSALQVLLELGMANIPIAAIAKKEEELFLPFSDESIILNKYSQGLYLIQRIRDEAHRFAITYHRNIRKKQYTKSSLDSIKGVGIITKKLLMEKFKSIDIMKKSSIEELATIKKVNHKLATKILNKLNSI